MVYHFKELSIHVDEGSGREENTFNQAQCTGNNGVCQTDTLGTVDGPTATVLDSQAVWGLSKAS